MNPTDIWLFQSWIPLHNGGGNRKDILEEETFSPNVTPSIIPSAVCSYQLPNVEWQLIIPQLYPDFEKKKNPSPSSCVSVCLKLRIDVFQAVRTWKELQITMSRRFGTEQKKPCRGIIIVVIIRIIIIIIRQHCWSWCGRRHFSFALVFWPDQFLPHRFLQNADYFIWFSFYCFCSNKTSSVIIHLVSCVSRS